MTDDAMKDLVTKHDATITQLVHSVEHLVQSQTETNKRLEEISKFLAKQAVFSTRLEEMDKNLYESFSRVHKRIDNIENTQTSEFGCNSVKLLNKDIISCNQSIKRLEVSTLEQKGKLELLTDQVNQIPKPSTLKWAIGILAVYSISFGTFVIDGIYKERAFAQRQEVINTEITKELLELNKLLSSDRRP